MVSIWFITEKNFYKNNDKMILNAFIYYLSIYAILRWSLKETYS